MIDFEAAADAVKRAPTDEEIKGCAEIAKRILRKEREIVDMQKQVSGMEKDLATLVELTLPNAMHAIGITEFKLLDGSLVSIGEEYYCNIPSADSDEEHLRARRAAAFAWLRENNQADLIKNDLKASFGRGEDKQADAFVMAAAEQGLSVTRSENVHWQTLKAWVKDRIEKGKDVPLETFGVHVRNVATIKGPKKK